MGLLNTLKNLNNRYDAFFRRHDLTRTGGALKFLPPSALFYSFMGLGPAFAAVGALGAPTLLLAGLIGLGCAVAQTAGISVMETHWLPRPVRPAVLPAMVAAAPQGPTPEELAAQRQQAELRQAWQDAKLERDVPGTKAVRFKAPAAPKPVQ